MNRQTAYSVVFSLRSRILIFSVLVTLVPSFGMGWFFSDMMRKTTTEKTERQWQEAAGRAEREIGQWLQERERDLRALASSALIVEGLTASGPEPPKGKGLPLPSAARRITIYLNAVQGQFREYGRLAVFSRDGTLVAASGAEEPRRFPALPADCTAQIDRTGRCVGEAVFSEEGPSPLVVEGIPVAASGASVGIFAVELRLQELMPVLRALLGAGEAGIGDLRLVQQNGRGLLTTDRPTDHAPGMISEPEMQLFSSNRRLRALDVDNRLVGLAVAFKELPWGILIEQRYDQVYADVLLSRERIILIALLVSLVIGLCASLLAGQIILPLHAVMQGVLRVASGHLDVVLDVRRNDEFGVVARMFNEMVARLRENQRELEHLATTDVLTGLANRKQIMTSLETQIGFFRRYGTEFSVLMVDIDHFKVINDTWGHQVGDAVLAQLAQIFRDLLRSIDIAGRYGGEEFLIILGQTVPERAALTAERIRVAVEQHPFGGPERSLSATVSIGVAGVRGDDETEKSLISRADAALYAAKTAGRNRVVSSGGQERLPAP